LVVNSLLVQAAPCGSALDEEVPKVPGAHGTAGGYFLMPGHPRHAGMLQVLKGDGGFRGVQDFMECDVRQEEATVNGKRKWSVRDLLSTNYYDLLDNKGGHFVDSIFKLKVAMSFKLQQ